MRKVKIKTLRVVFRVGIWLNTASDLRAAYRNYGSPSNQSNFFSARLVRGKR